MSRFLRNQYVCLGCCMTWGIAVLTLYLYKHYLCMAFLLGGTGLFAINYVVYKKMKQGVDQLNAGGNVRNVDYLVIGEKCNFSDLVPAGSTCFEITAPQRSLVASYEILRHTFSILKENGTVIILDGKKSTGGFSIFDIPFLHAVTIKRLNLHHLKKIYKIPLLVSPIKSLRLFRAFHIDAHFEDEECPKKEIIQFCESREIKLIYKRVFFR